MKKTAILLIAVLCICAVFSLGSSPGTGTSWTVLRAVSSTDDTGLAAAGAKWLDVSDDVLAVNLDDSVGALAILFKITNAADETANWCLYAAKGVGSPAEFVAYGTCTAGLTETGEAYEFFADTIVITVQNWYKTVSIKAGYQYNLGTGVVTGAGISALILDSCEYTQWLMLMSKGTCATAGAEVTNFN